MSKVLTSEPLTDRQKEQILEVSDPWSNQRAGKIVVADFQSAADYRSQNHDERWKLANDLYMAHVDQKVWPGTRIPRSSLGVFLTFQQVESFLPRALSAIFGNDPWFEVVAGPGTRPQAARAAHEIMLSQLDDCHFRDTLLNVVKSALIYGNGILALDWMYEENQVRRPIVEFVPRTQTIQGLNGQPLNVPTQQFDRRLTDTVRTEVTNRPDVRYIPLVDFYIDPNCRSSNPKDARFVVERTRTDLDDLKALRGADGWDIPSDPELRLMSEQRIPEQAEQTLRYIEMARAMNWDPFKDTTEDLSGHTAIVLHYQTAERMIKVIHSGVHSHVVYNEPNPLGSITYYNIPYANMLDRFYALAVTDVLEGEQRFQQAVINARVDELALSIHPPTVHFRGINVPAHQLRQRPGALIPAEQPDKHLVRQFPNNVTDQAFAEVNASELRAQKYTGLNDLAIVGAPTERNPAARTATGAGAQAQAAFARIQYFVENLETSVLECLLNDVHLSNQLFLDPNQTIAAADGNQVDPIEIFGADLKMKMRASSRMASKQAMMQFFPTVFQTLATPQLLQQLAQQGLTVDFVELFNVLNEISQYKGRAALVRPLSEQEQQQLQQSQGPNAEEMKLLMQRERMQDMERLEGLKAENEAELQGQAFEQETVRELLNETAKAALAPPPSDA